MAKQSVGSNTTIGKRLSHARRKEKKKTPPAAALPITGVDRTSALVPIHRFDDARAALRHDLFHRDEIVKRLMAGGPDHLAAHVYRRYAADRRVARRVDGLDVPAGLSWAEIAAWAKREGLVDEGEARLLAWSPPVGTEMDDADVEPAGPERAPDSYVAPIHRNPIASNSSGSSSSGSSSPSL